MQQEEKNTEAMATAQELAACFSKILKQRLVGVYLHGSLALGDFVPGVSDIDLLVVTRTAPSFEEKSAVLQCLWQQNRALPAKGVEMSIVTEAVCRHSCDPPVYLFHYSPRYEKAYREDLAGTCAMLQGTDPDLPAHFAVTRAQGRALMGPEPAELFAPIPKNTYLGSVAYDIEDAPPTQAADPVSAVLNLCRTLAFLHTGAICSKGEGGRWALQQKELLPFHPLIAAAAAARAGKEGEQWDAEMADRLWKETVSALLKARQE